MNIFSDKKIIALQTIELNLYVIEIPKCIS